MSLGYMLGGKDPVALDCLGLQLLKSVETSLRGQSPENVAYIAHALRLGVGDIEYEVQMVSRDT